MKHADFVEKVVDRGMEAAKKSYAHPDQKQKLEGSLAGLQACYSKDVPYLTELLEQAGRRRLHEHGKEDYWYYACFHSEIEWVCNCVSAVLHNQGLPVIIPPTARAVLLAATIMTGEQEWK